MAAPKMVSAVVAPGRTVFAEVISGKAWDADSKREIDVSKPSSPKGPGEVVMLTEQDAKRLRSLGYLVTEGLAPINAGPGPMFDVKEGPQIKVA